jgi:hypothetical protein
MVAAGGLRWQARGVRRLVVVALLAAAVGLGAPSSGARAAGPARPTLAQAPAGAPGGARVMTFAWTLYPRMWAELDLRMVGTAEAVAEISVEGGQVSWNLHTHPPDAPLSAYQVLAQGVAARATVRCAPEAPGLYSYLFGNDRADRPVRLRVELHLTGDARLEAVKP